MNNVIRLSRGRFGSAGRLRGYSLLMSAMLLVFTIGALDLWPLSLPMLAGGLAMHLYSYSLRRWERSYRLRLLPTGIRITENHRTRNLHLPLIVQPDIQRQGWQLKLRDGPQTVRLDLRDFSRADRAAIIEHCSQFLTPDQQRTCGQQWTRLHAQLSIPEKPVDLLQLWNIITVWIALSILATPALIALFGFGFPEGSTIWTPEMQLHFIRILAGLVLFGPCFFALICVACWLDGKNPEQSTKVELRPTAARLTKANLNSLDA